MKLWLVFITTVAIFLLISLEVESRKQNHRRNKNKHGSKGSKHSRGSKHGSKGSKGHLNNEKRQKWTAAQTFDKFLTSYGCDNSPVYRLFMMHYRTATTKPDLSPAEMGENYLWLRDLANAVKPDGTEGNCPIYPEPKCRPRNRSSGRSINGNSTSNGDQETQAGRSSEPQTTSNQTRPSKESDNKEFDSARGTTMKPRNQ